MNPHVRENHDYGFKDVLLVNLGPGGHPGPGWLKYNRPENGEGCDQIGCYYYSGGNEWCSDQFEPHSCNLLADSQLIDDIGNGLKTDDWHGGWYYRIGALPSDMTLSVTSSGQNMYVTLRTYWPYQGPGMNAPEDGNAYGFLATYQQGKRYA